MILKGLHDLKNLKEENRKQKDYITQNTSEL